MEIAAVAEHKLASVTVTAYKPAGKLAADVPLPSGEFHEKTNGNEPFMATTDALPSFPEKQVTGVEF